MDKKNINEIPKGCQIGCASFIILLVFAAIIGLSMQSCRNIKLKNTSDPAEIVKLIIDFEDKNAGSVTTQHGQTVEVVYNADPWALTEGMVVDKFYEFTKQLTPVLFSKIPSCEKVIIRATASMNSIRGTESRGEILTISFTRENSQTINWDKILYSNVPKLADFFYSHHSINTGF